MKTNQNSWRTGARARRCAIAIAVLVVLGFSTWYLRIEPGAKIRRSSYELIQLGTSKSDVESMIGCAPGIYCPLSSQLLRRDDEVLTLLPVTVYAQRSLPKDERRFFDEEHAWIGPHGAIILTIDSNGIVTAKEFFEVRVPPLTTTLVDFVTGKRPESPIREIEKLEEDNDH